MKAHTHLQPPLQDFQHMKTHTHNHCSKLVANTWKQQHIPKKIEKKKKENKEKENVINKKNMEKNKGKKKRKKEEGERQKSNEEKKL